MKSSATRSTPPFTPIVVTLTLESPAEVIAAEELGARDITIPTAMFGGDRSDEYWLAAQRLVQGIKRAVGSVEK